MLLCQFLRRHLRVSSGVRVNNEALYIGHVGQEREYLQIVAETPCCVLITIYLEGEDAAAAIGEILLIESMVVTMQELTAAVQANWSGFENLRTLIIKKGDFFGNDTERSNSIA